MRRRLNSRPPGNERATGRTSFSLLLSGLCLLATIGAGRLALAEPLTIGSSHTGVLVWLAEAQRGYADAGVDARLEKVSSGVEAVRRVAEGDLDLGTSSEFAFTNWLSRHPGDLCIYATLSASRTVRLLGRSDRVGPTAADLRGKRIGVTFGSAARFFLWQYLVLSGVPEDAVDLVNLKPADLVEAIVADEVAAIIVWEPFATRAERRLPVPTVEYPGQSLQHYYFVLHGKCSLAEERPEDLKAVLSALHAADLLARDDPQAAKTLIAPLFGNDQSVVDDVWNKHSLRLSLPQDLISLMEIQGQWIVEQNPGERTPVTVLDHIKPAPLDTVAPHLVQMVW